MNSIARICLVASFLLVSPVWAGSGAPASSCLDNQYSLRGAIVDPFSSYLPSGLDSTSSELSRSYSIELKSFRADDMSRYQFKTVDNRGLGAGYSSPYLWEVGRGPGQASPSGRWLAPMDGRAYSPIPMGR